MAGIDQKKFLASLKRGLTLGTRALSLYQLHGFRERPFKEDLIEKNSYLFVPPQLFYESSQSLASWITACHSAGKNGLIIGSSDVGKSTLAKFFVKELEKLAKELPIQSHYIQLKGLAEASEMDRKTEEVIIGGPNAIGLEAELHNRNLMEADILLIDDIDIGLRRENFVNELSRYARSEDQTIVGITTPSVPSEIIDLFDDVYRIKSIEHETIVKILTTRIYYYKENGEKTDSTREITPFTEEALKSIAEYSMGLPGLALNLADSCLQGITDFNVTEITPETVDYVAQILQYPIAKDIRIGNSIYYVDEEDGERKQKELNLNVTGSKVSILKEILFQSRLYLEKPGITNTKLSNSARISIQAHTISYHTNILEKCKILEVQEGLRSKKRGRSRYFYLRKPIMNAIELRFLPQQPPSTSEVILKR
jgi:DNA replication protein DnaC